MISDQIALHSVQLPLLIGQFHSTERTIKRATATKKKSWIFLCFDLKKSLIYRKFWSYD